MLQRLPSYLIISRHNVYYFQYRVPLALQSLYGGRKLIRKSLHTRDRRLALSLAHRWWQKLKKDEYANLDNQLSGEADLYRTGKLVYGKYEQIDQLDMHAEDEFFARLSDFDRAALKHFGDATVEPAVTNVRQHVEPTSSVPPVMQPNNNDVLIAKIDELISNQLRTSVNEPKQSTIKKGKPLSKLVEDFIDDSHSGWNSPVATERSVRTHLNLVVDVLDDALCSEVDKAAITKVKKLISRLPVRWKLIKPYRNKDADDLLNMEIPERHIIAASTQKDYMVCIGTFLDWCAEHDYMPADLKDVFKRLKKTLRNKARANEERDAFNDDDLKSLFNSKQYLQSTHKKNGNHWVPLLALFTGARQAELCQLDVGDIHEDVAQSFYYIDINDNGIHKTKTAKSNRKIPVHKQLIALGFIDFVKSTHTKRLFPELVRRSDNRFNAFSVWFNGTYRNKLNCNVGQNHDETKDFHSFRHTLLNAGKQSEANMSVIREIAGHSESGSETDVRYTDDYKLELRNKAIQKIKFKSIDFKQIRPWKQVVKLQKNR